MEAEVARGRTWVWIRTRTKPKSWAERRKVAITGVLRRGREETHKQRWIGSLQGARRGRRDLTNYLIVWRGTSLTLCI